MIHNLLCALLLPSIFVTSAMILLPFERWPKSWHEEIVFVLAGIGLLGLIIEQWVTGQYVPPPIAVVFIGGAFKCFFVAWIAFRINKPGMSWYYPE